MEKDTTGIYLLRVNQNNHFSGMIIYQTLIFFTIILVSFLFLVDIYQERYTFYQKNEDYYLVETMVEFVKQDIISTKGVVGTYTFNKGVISYRREDNVLQCVVMLNHQKN